MASKFGLGLMCVLMAVMTTKAQFGPVPLNVGFPVGPGIGIGVAPGDFFAYPRYQYGYGVSDRLTGDEKTASEHRDGHVVNGQYSLREPDGGFRQVTYVADLGGFRANVQRTPGAPGVAVGPAVVPGVGPVGVPVGGPVGVPAFGRR